MRLRWPLLGVVLLAVLLAVAKPRYSGTSPRMAPWKLLQIQLAIWVLDARARRLDLAAPWAHRLAATWDRETLDAARRRFMWSPDARGVMDAAMRTVFGADSDELSLFHVLAYVRSAGGAREAHLHRGRLPAGPPRGRRAVHRPRPRPAGRRRARPPGLPGLRGEPRRGRSHRDGRREDAPRRARRRRRAAPSSGEDGRRGEVLRPLRARLLARARALRRGRLQRGPLAVTFDASSADGTAPCLLAFIGGRAARQWHTHDPEHRKQAVLARLAAYFGEEARRPLAWAEADWTTETWSGGGPVALFPPGTLSAHGAAPRAPVGRLHFAGTETAERCMGYIEGAVESGQRAAREVMA